MGAPFQSEVFPEVPLYRDWCARPSSLPAESAEKLDAATATQAPAVRRHMNAAFFAKLSLLLSIGAAYFGFGAVGCSLLALSAAAIVTAAALAAEA